MCFLLTASPGVLLLSAWLCRSWPWADTRQPVWNSPRSRGYRKEVSVLNTTSQKPRLQKVFGKQKLLPVLWGMTPGVYLSTCHQMPQSRCPCASRCCGRWICTDRQTKHICWQWTLWGGLQNAVVQVNLAPTILSFTKHLWLQPLIPIKMPVSLSERMLTKNISHWHSSINEYL